MLGAQALAAEFLATFKEPRQKLQSFSLDQIVEKMLQPTDD